jgi:hypothetical protein
MKFIKLAINDLFIKNYKKDRTVFHYKKVSNDTSEITFSENAIRIAYNRKNENSNGKINYMERSSNLDMIKGEEHFYGSLLYDIDVNSNNKVYFYKFIGHTGDDCNLNFQSHKYLLFNNDLYFFDNTKYQYSDEKIEFLLKEYIYKEDDKFKRLEKLITLYEEKNEIIEQKFTREPIPQEVKEEVFIRDEGKCVICGTQEDLQYDHIIPVSKGGSNTAKNIQILCKHCNLKKLNNI